MNIIAKSFNVGKFTLFLLTLITSFSLQASDFGNRCPGEPLQPSEMLNYFSLGIYEVTLAKAQWKFEKRICDKDFGCSPWEESNAEDSKAWDMDNNLALVAQRFDGPRFEIQLRGRSCHTSSSISNVKTLSYNGADCSIGYGETNLVCGAARYYTQTTSSNKSTYCNMAPAQLDYAKVELSGKMTEDCLNLVTYGYDHGAGIQHRAELHFQF